MKSRTDRRATPTLIAKIATALLIPTAFAVPAAALPTVRPRFHHRLVGPPIRLRAGPTPDSVHMRHRPGAPHRRAPGPIVRNPEDLRQDHPYFMTPR